MNALTKPWLSLLCALLMACASTPTPPPESVEWDASFWTCEALEDTACFTLSCSEDACTLFRAEETPPSGVVLTKGARPVTAPEAALRYWVGILIRAPWGHPVFITPWNHRKPLLPSQRLMLEEARRLAKEHHEKHHIFPQEQGLKLWFESRGINIHRETMLMDVATHRRIHQGPNGGPWNQAWRDFRRANPGATQKEMYEHAWKLIKDFKLVGFIVPYHDKPPYLIPPPTEY